MNARLKRVLFALLLVQALFLPAVLGRGNGDRPGVVDVYIKTYIINKRDTTQYTDEKGTTHYSKRDFYLSTAARGTMGGPVKYRFFIEYVNLSMRDPAMPPLFKDSYAEMIDSATVLPEVLRQLPSTFTNPRHHE
jgi:hypothetical protein